MTVAEKRKALDDYCDSRSCRDCLLHGKAVCNCGYGKGFHYEQSDSGYMTDAEIIGAYEIVFGTKAEVELETCIDNLITISNVDKIQSISIYFKEEN